MSSLLAGLVPIVASALAAAAAEQASDQAAGRPSPPGWFGRFAAAAHQFQAEVQKQYANVPSLLPEADKNCPLLPGPEDSQPCQQAGEQVEDQIKRATQRLSHDLAREIDVLETTTSDAAASGARTRLLVALRAALPRLVTC